MRYNYPISSQELLDHVDQVYDMQLYILGHPGASGALSGVLNNIESSGVTIFSSGIQVFDDLNCYIGKNQYILNQINRK